MSDEEPGRSDQAEDAEGKVRDEPAPDEDSEDPAGDAAAPNEVEEQADAAGVDSERPHGEEALERFKQVVAEPGAPEARPGNRRPGAHRAPKAPPMGSLGPLLGQMGGRMAAYARAHPNRTLFAVGVVLFASGLVGVIGSQTGPDAVDEMVSGASDAGGGAPAQLIGPELGDPVAPYIESKRNLLSERAQSDPQVFTLALVVFNRYLTAGETEQFLAVRSLSGLAAQVRAPVEGLEPDHVALVGRSLAAAATWQAGEVDEDLAVLEGLAQAADDEDYRAIYNRELERYRRAAELLDQPSPATVFAVVIHATYQTLSGVQGAPEVRFVDVPVDPTLALQDTEFVAPIPEDTERVSITP